MSDVKNKSSAPLVGNPGNIVSGPSYAPSVAIDHALPLHHARTEAALVAGLALAVIIGAGILFDVRNVRAWFFALSAVGILFLAALLVRYEHHISYVRDDRRPEAADVDLDLDGQPDRVHAVWYGNGALAARPGTLSALYSLRFAAFVAACQRVGTTVRALRAEGFDDATISLFQNWLMDPTHPAAQWVSTAGHNPGWELADDATLRKVLRCTGWEAN